MLGGRGCELHEGRSFGIPTLIMVLVQIIYNMHIPFPHTLHTPRHLQRPLLPPAPTHPHNVFCFPASNLNRTPK